MIGCKSGHVDAYFKRDFLWLWEEYLDVFFSLFLEEKEKERERGRERQIALLFSFYLMNNKQIIIHEMFESS